jgi:hypothetical protein
MATIQELEDGLRKAHAAGNTEHARRFADEIRKQRAQQGGDPGAAYDRAASRAYAGTGTDQFGRKPAPSRVDQAPKSRTMGDRYDSYISGVGKSMRDTGVGFKQMISEGLETRADSVWNLMGRPGADKGDPIGKLRQYNQRSRDDEARLRASLPGMGEDPEFAFGNVVGTISQLLTPGAAFRGTNIGRAALPATIKGNVLQGMAVGTTQPVAEQGERGMNQAVGGIAGWLGAVAPRAVSAVTRPVRSALSDLLGQPTASGVERRAADLIRQEAANPAALMRPQPSAVPGVQRTLAEESLDPGVARLERQMRGSGPAGVFTPIDQANAAARVRSIESIAGTDAELAAANQARSSASQQARIQAMQSGPVDVSQTILTLEDAIRAQEGRPAVQAGLRQVRDLLLRERQAAPGTVTGVPEDRITVLENVRQTIGDMLGGRYGGDNAAALQGSRELISVRDALNKEIGDQVPAFAQYLDAYRQGSLPINRMEIGRELLDRGAGSAIADPVTGVRPLTPAGFSRQANDLDSVAARATGFDKARADQILTPDDIAKIRSVQDDLERQAFRATAGSGGNSMTQERQALARRMGRSAIQSVPVVGRFAESLEAMGEKRLNDTLARLIANPEEARRVLSTLNAKDRAVVNKALLQISARTGAAVPALTE